MWVKAGTERGAFEMTAKQTHNNNLHKINILSQAEMVFKKHVPVNDFVPIRCLSSVKLKVVASCTTDGSTS